MLATLSRGRTSCSGGTLLVRRPRRHPWPLWILLSRAWRRTGLLRTDRLRRQRTRPAHRRTRARILRTRLARNAGPRSARGRTYTRCTACRGCAGWPRRDRRRRFRRSDRTLDRARRRRRRQRLCRRRRAIGFDAQAQRRRHDAAWCGFGRRRWRGRWRRWCCRCRRFGFNRSGRRLDDRCRRFNMDDGRRDVRDVSAKATRWHVRRRPALLGRGRCDGGFDRRGRSCFDRCRRNGLGLGGSRFGFDRGCRLGGLDEARRRKDRRCRLDRLGRLLRGRRSLLALDDRRLGEHVRRRQRDVALLRQPLHELARHDFLDRARGALHLDAVIALEERGHFLARGPEELCDLENPNSCQQ